MISKLFSCAVLAAVIYLVQQQFTRETEGAMEWAVERVRAVASQFSPGDGEPAGPPVSHGQADTRIAEAAPPPIQSDARAETTADRVSEREPDPQDLPARPTTSVETPPPAVSDTAAKAQGPAEMPALSDAGPPADLAAARARRDALAVLAERMETLALERAR